MALFGNGRSRLFRKGIVHAWTPAAPAPVDTVAPPSRATEAAAEPPADPNESPVTEKRNRRSLFRDHRARPATRFGDRRWWR